MFLKIPIHTIAQVMQLVHFLIGELFTIKQDVGLSRKLLNTRDNKKIMSYLQTKNKLFNHAFHN